MIDNVFVGCSGGDSFTVDTRNRIAGSIDGEHVGNRRADIVIPAQAGNQRIHIVAPIELGARLRGDDELHRRLQL